MKPIQSCLLCVSLVFCIFKPVLAAEFPLKGGLSAWVKDAVQATMTFDYNDFETKKETNKEFFTPSGYDSFYKAMDISLIPDVVKTDKLQVKAGAQCEPEITAMTGNQNWEVKLPLTLSYISSEGTKRQHQMIKLLVKRINKEGGFGIDQWVATPLTEAESSVCGGREQTKARIGELRREIAQRETELRALEAQLP